MQTVDFLLAVCQPTVGCLLAICQLLLVGAGHLLADCWLLAGHILRVNFPYSLPIHISLYVISISLMPMEICIQRLCGKLTWNICHLLTDCWLFAVHLLGACWLSVGRLLAACWPFVGRPLAVCCPSVSPLLAVCCSSVSRLLAVCWPSVSWLLAVCCPLVGLLLEVCWPAGYHGSNWSQ